MLGNCMDLLKGLEIETRAFIGGHFVPSLSGEWLSKQSSYDGRELPRIASCDERDVAEAVVAARKAFLGSPWASSDPEEKMAVMFRLADLMEEHREEIAALDALETSRAFRNYYYDSIPKAIEALRYFAQGLDKIYDVAIPPRKHAHAIITRVPLGVVGIVTPWNDPMVVSTWKFAPALLMGNSVILKPAEESSLSILKVASLMREAGVPDGVFNVVPGRGEVAGRALALHPDVDGVFFTGSTEVGKKMLEYSGRSNMKKVGLECGGKGPYIVTKNCRRVREAARVLANNMFYNQGQICSAPSRAIVDRIVYDEFLEALKTAAEEYVPGPPYDIRNNVGCLVSKKQYARVQGFIETARREFGGDCVYQAKRCKEMPAEAQCIQPTIISGAGPKSLIAQQEIFGPVVVVFAVDSLNEALSLANDTQYGLAGAVWTDDFNEAVMASRKIEAGLVHVNSYGEDGNMAPFGGVKQSGLGKDRSLYAFDEYSEKKTTWMRLEHF